MEAGVGLSFVVQLGALLGVMRVRGLELRQAAKGRWQMGDRPKWP